HEYTHILHQNETPWAITELNAILGKVFFGNFDVRGVPSYVLEYIPDFLSDSPRFVTEGWAVTTESKFTPGGRAKEGDLDMRLRMATLEGRQFSIDQVNGSYLLDWPSGGNEYDYGTAFFDYIVTTYGEDKPAEILSVLGKMPWLGMDYAVSRVMPGKTCNSLWDETLAWLKQRYANQVANLKQEPLTVSKALTRTGRHHHHPRWLLDGTLSVTESYKGKPAGLIKVAPASGAATRIFGKDSLGDYSVSSDNRYFYYSTQGDDENRFQSYSDLYRYDAVTHEAKRLTQGMRAVEPAVSPNGKSLVAVATAKGSNYLVLLDGEGKLLKSLTEPTLDETWANPAWAPDGKHFVVSRWKEGRYNLVQVDPATGAQEALTTGDALDFYPAYSPDGQYVTFTSDRNGVFNLHALRLGDRKLFRITNVVGGAFDGRVSPDGKQIAFLNYTSQGYDLHLTAFDPATFKPVKMDQVLTTDFKGQFVPRVAQQATPVDMDFALSAAPRPYSPWPSMMPHVYAPYFTNNATGLSAGLILHGQDILRQHTYFTVAASGLTGAVAGQPITMLYYQNDQLLPSLSATYLRAPSPTLFPLFQADGSLQLGYMWQDQQSLDVSARFPGIPLPLLGSDWVTGDSFQLGFRGTSTTNYGLGTMDLQQFRRLTPAEQEAKPNYEFTRDVGQANSVYAAFQRANNYKRSYGFTPEGGSLATLGYQKTTPALGGTGNFDRVWGDYRRYISLPWQHHVLAVRGVTGMSWGQNGGQYFLGGNESETFFNQVDLTAASNLFDTSVPLRGYPFATRLGNKLAMVSAEYRFPILSVDKGLWTLPIYLEQVYGALGYDAGNVWDVPYTQDRTMHWDQTLQAVSFELRSKLSLFRYIRTDLRLGVAQGLSATGPQYTLTFGSTF
ncbi:MAG TPA: BamA/TamA family outer membrane protein, partial [Stenomitos sp.]